MKKLGQKGFSAVEVLVVILVIGLIGTVGWLVYDRQSSKSSTESQPNQSSVTSESTICGKDWTTIDHKNVELPDWNVSLTLEDELLGKVACRKDPNANPQYMFTTTGITEKKCYEHLSGLQLSDPVVSIWRHSSNESALGNLFSDDNNKQTFQQYYDEHRMQGSNYVLEESGEVKYYKVSDGFYAQNDSEVYDLAGIDVDIFKPGVQPFELDTKKLEELCPDLNPGYMKQFGDLAAVLKESN